MKIKMGRKGKPKYKLDIHKIQLKQEKEPTEEDIYNESISKKYRLRRR